MVDTMVAGGTPDLYYEYYQYPPDMQHLCPMRHEYGPVTVPMVSTNSSPPIAMPVQVPPGHVVQQIVDESGTLRHVILSPNHHPLVPIPQHFGAGNPSGSNQPQGYYPGAMPHGYGIFSPLQPGVLGHGPPQGHSPPPLNYHKPERTQRQYNKLKRRLEQKQMQQSQTTPPLSPRKELNGNSKKGVGSVGTSEDGEESSSLQDEEEEVSLLVDILGTIKPPQVSEVTSRSALVQWVPPQMENQQDLSYEVLLSDKGTEGKYKSLYSGEALSCRIEDLTPGTEYCVCVSARLDNVVGCASEPTPLITPPCRPDPPTQVKLSSRSRNTLTIKWQGAVDNGARIDHYIVEWDVNGVWTELIRHKNKQAHIPKLQPATSYAFRVAAVNKCGKSDYTSPLIFQTCDSPPSQPGPPSLSHATPNSLALHWISRPQDDEYMLQMEDPDTGHGFLSVYNGKETSYVCTALRSYTTYKFRLKAQNEEGSSRWSEETRFRTLPGWPGAPSSPQVTKVRSCMCKISWDPPSDKGGTSIICYVVQLAQCTNKPEFHVVYNGDNTSCTLDKLLPGTSYIVRVCCEGPGGRSDFSEPTIFTTGALCPGQCPTPRLHGKPRPYSVTLKCGYPDSDGGAPLTKMVVAIVKDDGGKEIVATIDSDGEEMKNSSKKVDTECVIEDLLPAHQYSFCVRASNQLGAGVWSKSLEVQTACARPDCPAPPNLVAGSGYISCSWTPPSDNGSPITQYTLLMATPPGENYSPVYTGPATHCDVKPVLPATLLLFKLQATNNLGTSPSSKINTILTSPGVPSAVPNLKGIPAPTSLELMWGEPLSNGDPITHYIVEAGDIATNVTETACTIENLTPSTSYRVKVRGVNGVGVGAVSTVKLTTLPPPPPPPVLTCNMAGHNYLKLRWGGPNTNHDNINFTVYMYAPNTSRKTVVYEGTSTSYKVNRLQEQTEYGFVIVASNSSGKGPESEVFKFSTVIAPPPPVKGLKVSDVQSRSCQVEWSPLRPQANDPLEYIVQCSRLREQTYRQVYQGGATKCQMSDLEPAADYLVRVAAVRQSVSGPIDGPFSPPVNFSTPNIQLDSNPVQSVRQQSVQVRKHQNGGQRPLTDQQWAGIILCGFSVLAVLISLVIAQIKY